MSGSLIIDLEGYALSPIEQELLQHPQVAGVLLFTRNYSSVAQLKEFIAAIRNAAQRPILITVDHEGGKIWRFYEGFTYIPAMANFGTLYEHDPALALQQIQAAGTIIAHELLNCGVDLSLTPVLDLQGINTVVIGDRGLHSDPEIVVALAAALIQGMQSCGMNAIGKHFPGHGGCNIDTHTALAFDERLYAEISKTDLVPFKRLAHTLGGVMPAHVIYPDVDDVSAGFSKIWLQQILRAELQFDGAIISDCVAMKGAEAQGDVLARIQAALYAGCDLVIVSQQQRAELMQILQDLAWQPSQQQLARIAKLYGDLNNPKLQQALPKLAEIWAVNAVNG